MLKKRLATAAIGIPLVCAAALWPGGLPAVVLVGAVLTLAFSEFAALCSAAGIPCRIWWGTAGIILLVIFAQARVPAPQWLPEAAIFLSWAFLIVETGRPDRKPVSAIGTTLMGVAWIGGLGSCLLMVRFWSPHHGAAFFGADGRPLLALLIIVWALDSAAFFAGRLFGRTKIAPSISPRKTVEGALGGFFAAAAAGILTAPMMGQSPADGAALGAAIGVAGQVGDLFESAVKRELGAKDSGASLPGHGGWLDRIDSLLFAAGVTAWWLMRA